MAKLHKSKRGSGGGGGGAPKATAAATTSSSKLPRAIASSSPIAIRSTAKAAAPQTSSAHVAGHTSSDNGSATIPRSQSSASSLQACTTPPSPPSLPIPRSSSSSTTSPPTTHTTSIDTSPRLESTSSTLVGSVVEAEHDHHQGSALSQLRKQMQLDEEKRKEQAALAAEREAMDRDVKPRKLLRKKHRRQQDSIDAGSMMSYDELEEDPTPEPEPQPQPTQDVPPPPPSPEHIADPIHSLALTTPSDQQEVAPTYYLLALPRYGIHCLVSTIHYSLETTKSLILLPFQIASHLPLIGTHIPFTHPPPPHRQSTITFAPAPPSRPHSRPTSIRSARSAPVKDNVPEEKGLAWQAAELSLGLTLAGVLIAGAGVSTIWEGVTGASRRKGKGKAKK